MVFQLICWWVSYTFVLASSAWTCEKDLSEVPYFMLNGCQFGCAVLCGLVPVCGSAIIRRSSRSPQGFGASLPVAWLHPTLASIKLFTCCSQQSYPYSWTYYCEDRAILVLEYIGTYHVVSELLLLRYILLSPAYLSFVYHLLLFLSITYICFSISYSPLKSHTKNSIAFCWYWLSCVVCTHLVAC